MKKTLVILLCLASLQSFSQARIGVEGGWNSSRFSGEDDEISAVNSFNAGVVSEVPLCKKTFLRSSLTWSGNGSKIGLRPDIYPGYYSNTTVKLNYLKIPVDILYKIKVSNKLKAFGGAGLYAARGLSGTEKGYAITYLDFPPYQQTANIDNKVEFTGTSSNPKENTTFVKPFDFGCNALAGIEWKSFQLTANYSHGFSKIYSNTHYDLKNTSFSLSLAYLFSLKK